MGFLGAIGRSGRWGRCFPSICSVSALLSLQLLPQPRFSGRRATCSPGLSCCLVLRLASTQPTRGARVQGNWGRVRCGVQEWQPGLRSCLQTSAARSVGSYALEPAALPAASLPTDKGTEEGWLTLERRKSWRPQGPTRSFSKY